MGIMLPWHLGDVQRQAIRTMRDRLEAAVEQRVDDAAIDELLGAAVVVAVDVAETSRSVINVHLKMDCARMTLECIRAGLHRK